MSKRNFKEQSRDNWHRPDGEGLTNDQIKVGCLQRIADATEAMARSYVQLESERDRYKKWYYEERAEKERLQRSITAHKSNYTRLKNKLEAMKDAEA